MKADCVFYLPKTPADNTMKRREEISSHSIYTSFIIERSPDFCSFQTAEAIPSKDDQERASQNKQPGKVTCHKAHSKVSSEEDFAKVLKEEEDKTTVTLCEDASGVDEMKKLFDGLDIEVDVFCPQEPFNHHSSILEDFLEKIDQEGKGKCKDLIPFFL